MKKTLVLIVVLALVLSLIPAGFGYAVEVPVQLGQQQNISGVTEKEFVFTTYTVSSSYVIETDSYTGADTVLYLYNAAHQLITSDDNSGINGCSLIKRDMIGGTYYIKVTGKNGSLISCNLRIDDMAALPSIGVNSPIKIGSNPDKYYEEYKINVANAMTYFLETSMADAANDFNTVITLYDQNHSIIANNDDIGGGCLYSRITQNIFSTGTYYLKIRNYAANPVKKCVVGVYDGSATPTVFFSTPQNNGYFFLGGTVSFNVTGHNVGGGIALSYVHNTGTENMGGMTFNSAGNNYTMSYQFNTWRAPFYSNGAYSMPKFRAVGYGPRSNVTVEMNGYIARDNQNFYSSSDSTFYYNSETDNSFLGVGTDFTDPRYNCLSYVIGVNNVVTWPWPNSCTIDEIKDFMTKQGLFNNRSGDYYLRAYTSDPSEWIAFPDAIYYGGGHFAKVEQCNSQGVPTRISSKWGMSELIKSESQNPFTNNYGAPVMYFKYRIDQ